MEKMKKRVVSLLCMAALLFGSYAWMIPANAEEGDGTDMLIEESNLPLRLWYDEPAPITDTENSPNASSELGGSDIAWEQWSLPIGNGYFGANVFGRTETERIQITDKTLVNNFGDSTGRRLVGGLNSFSETYIDFGHTEISDYTRYLDMKTAISGVAYTSGGVRYTREYFVSYPDRAIVIRLDADVDGGLSFTLRPTVPHKQDYRVSEGDGGSKTGTVESTVENGVGKVELHGRMGVYEVDFLGIYKVYTSGGTVTASTAENTYTDSAGISHTDTNGTIVVDGAKSAYIVITLGTDYELSSEMFTSANSKKPTTKTTLEDTRVKVEGDMNKIEEKIKDKSFDEGYELLRTAHVFDHSSLFGRVSLDLNCDESDFALTTDALLASYQAGEASTYLEVLLFQYGRYLLVASSREGTLPANLQGVWNTYNNPPWGSGYWFNINIQMNYWPAFSTNLAETFSPLADLNLAHMQKLESLADTTISTYYPELYDQDGGNGWSISTGTFPYTVGGDRSAGNLGFTTQLYWEYYEYTKDPDVLALVYDLLTNAARFITKIVSEDADGNYLVDYCDSPEVHVNGIWYYTSGTTYAQTFAYLNNYHALLAAAELGIDLENEALLSGEDYSILKTILSQIDKYDPIHIGLSGQIKEFREETYYSSIGDDPNHRHVSQLVGLYPGNLINGTTPAWLDAAKKTLELRGGNTTGGWVYAHKTGLFARAKDGEGAHDRVNELLTLKTCPNLFTLLWSVYQIDASLGVTAGMAEMLLQSHAGYIEPLAAMPEEWNTGSYTGLMARGNFEVSAAWENGEATVFNILSNNGGELSVYYPSVTGATVVTANGKTVKYTVSDTNLITFDTEAGETYIIYGFEKVEKPDAPTVLNYSRVGFGEFDLSWTPSDDAVSYNVYVAIENAPDYTLVSSKNATTASYLPTKENENARMTFAVTSVNAAGVESERTLCYHNPEDTSALVEEISASITTENELQVAVKANGNTAKFRLYEKAADSGEYQLIDESGFPLLYTANYNKENAYAVAVVSYYKAEESALVEIGEFGSVGVEYEGKNILLGKTFVQSEGAQYKPSPDTYSYDKLTDGSFVYNTGRFSGQKTTNAQSPKGASATVDLGGNYVLSELRIYAYERRSTLYGTNFTLEVFSNNEWITLYDSLSNEELTEKYVKIVGTTTNDMALCFDMGCVVASKIRFRADALMNLNITWYEMECSGILLEEKYSYADNILLGKSFVGAESVTTGYGYEKLTDGILSSVSSEGRYSSVRNGKINGTVALGGVYKLKELRLYDYAQKIENAGKTLKIEVCLGGEWMTAASVSSNAELQAYRVEESTSVGGAWLAFDLGGVLAEKIRITGTAVADQTITLYEIECSGMLVRDLGEYVDNILRDKEFVPAVGVTALNATYGYDKLTDGSFVYNAGRFSATKNKNADATVDLGKEYLLSEIKIYDYADGGNYGTDPANPLTPTHAGNNLTLEVYSDGQWITLYRFETLEDLQPYRVITGTKGHGQGWLSFSLNNIRAEKIRFFATPSTTTQTVSYYEIECSGYTSSPSSTENVNSNAFAGKNITLESAFEEEYDILLGKEFVPTDAALAALDSSSKTYAALTDGCIHNNDRLTTAKGGVVEASVDLGELYNLNKFRFKWYSGAAYVGTTLKINLYRDGQWSTAIECTSNAEIWKHKSGDFLVFDLSGRAAEKIEVIVSAAASNQLSFAELECSGTAASKVAPTVIKPAKNANDQSTESYTEVGGAAYALVVDLGGAKTLHTLRICERFDEDQRIDGVLATASDQTRVEVYRDGVWLKVKDGFALNSASPYTEICLYGTECEKVRITFQNTRHFDGESEYRAAKISEIACTEGLVTVSLGELSAALKKLPTADREADPNNRYLYNETYAKFKEYALNTKASAEEVEVYLAEIEAYIDTVGSAVLSAYNISLGGDISMNFRYTAPSDILEKFPNAYLEFIIPSTTGNKTVQIYLKDTTPDSEGRFIFTVALAAAQMADTVTMRLVYDENTVGKTYQTSVREYAGRIIDSEAMEQAYPGISELIRAMLNYGGYAQLHFDYHTDTLANAGLYTAENDPVLNQPVADDSVMSITGAATGVKLSGWTISLLSETTARLYFALSDTDIASLKFTVTSPSGAKQTLRAIKDGNLYRVDIANIGAGVLDKIYSIEVTNTVDGTSARIEFSAMCYVSNVLANSTNTNLIDLAKALKLYSNAAKAYLEQN